MSEQQIAKLLGKLVEHQDCFGVLSSEEAQWAIQNPKSAITLMCGALKNRSTKTFEKLLAPVTSVLVEAVELFVVADKFCIGTIDNVKIGCLGINFKTYFLNKNEEHVPSAVLKVHKLLRSSGDSTIIDELGDVHETTLAYLWQLLLRQGTCSRGLLLTNGDANIFYIRDSKGELWGVFAHRLNGSWRIEAGSVGSQCQWDGGRQVFSG